jgi:hypothetical protein
MKEGDYITREERQTNGSKLNYANGLLIDTLKQRNDLTQEHSRLMKNDSEFRKDLNRLAVFRVYDMRYPMRTDKTKNITNTENFGEVLEVIYQVRCNLFHGKKSMDDPHDKELVELSYRILTNLFKPIADAL